MPGTKRAFTRVFDALWPGMTEQAVSVSF